jgi:hypothetical protein
MRVGTVTEWATGVTPPRRIVLAIRGDVHCAVHVAAMEFIGSLVAALGMLGKGMSINWKGVYANRPLRAPMRKVATEPNGYFPGRGDLTGCICPICQGRETSVPAPWEWSELRIGTSGSGAECQLRRLRSWDFEVRTVRRRHVVRMRMAESMEERQVAERDGAPGRRRRVKRPLVTLVANCGGQA